MLRKSLISIPTVAVMLILSSAVNAQVDPMITGGIEAGGENLVTTTTEDMSAGGGIILGAGASFSQPGSALSYRVMLNYLFDSVEFTSPSGKASVNALPLELGVFNTWSKHEVGGGLSYHINPTYEISSGSSFINNKINFDNAVGLFMQYNYIFSRTETETSYSHTYVGAKLTAIDYEVGKSSIDAGSFGIYIGSTF